MSQKSLIPPPTESRVNTEIREALLRTLSSLKSFQEWRLYNPSGRPVINQIKKPENVKTAIGKHFKVSEVKFFIRWCEWKPLGIIDLQIFLVWVVVGLFF